MGTLSPVRAPGVLRTLSLGSLTHLPLSAMGVLLILRCRSLGLPYAVGGVTAGAFTLGLAAGAPLVGRIVDRRGQSKVLLLTALVNGFAIIAIALLPTTLGALLVPLGALVGVSYPPVASCVRVVLTGLLTGRDRDAIFAVDVAIHQVAYMVGPLPLLSLAGGAGPSVALAVTSLVVVLGTFAFALGPEARATHAVGDALTHSGPRVTAHAGVLTIVAVMAAAGVSLGSVEVGVVVAGDRNHGEISLALLFSLWAFGAVVGGAAWAARRRDFADRHQTATALLLSVAAATLLLALPMPAWWLIPALFLVGLGTAPLVALFIAMMSAAAPPDKLTEACAWVTTGMTGGLALGNAAAGAIATYIGVTGVFVTGVAAMLASCVLWTRRSTTLNPLRADCPGPVEILTS